MKTYKVIGCRDCPFYRYDEWTGDRCAYPGGGMQFSERHRVAPNACGLRLNPIQVELIDEDSDD